MLKYAYIAFYMGQAIGAGTMAADKGSSVQSRLGKIYGTKKLGFSFIIHRMM